MSYRINRAMGWGMPWPMFEKLCLLPTHKHDAYEALSARFADVTGDDLTVPNEVHTTLFHANGPVRAPIIFEKQLLALEYTDGDRKTVKLGPATDLYEIVHNTDKLTDIVFFPNLAIKKRWCRFDDDMDYAFEQWSIKQRGKKLGDRGAQSGPRDFTIYTGYGHYPWANNLMLADGTPVAWDHFTTVEEHPEWLPAVPSEIRWYLTKLGVLFNEGVNELRPVIAQWWC